MILELINSTSNFMNMYKNLYKNDILEYLIDIFIDNLRILDQQIENHRESTKIIDYSIFGDMLKSAVE